ncbi:MAG TPA: protein-methionine-sulfoxide reductase catalytic subunit MsrP [Anaerolineae bacterium]|nr:protein-methionine-sulfoxide reductase catalytic subunit MsrP [Anaerolineae bacterium]HQI85489.1 protein-methionine-sulfoxide reductase catalytic subunit MsrP [Anaerolineae bacterium]
MIPIQSSEITPEHVYLSRRKFMQAAGLLAANAALLAACGRQPASPPASTAAPDVAAPSATLSAATDELGDPLTPLDSVLSYNNFYEFSFTKEDVARLSRQFSTSPWQVTVGGLVNKPRTFDLDDLRKFEQEERIYRMRCVEAWSMVIPWLGFPLSRLLKEVEPLSTAKYVQFETLYDPEALPGQKNRGFPWPYVEGLRLDEAMHDLTLLATGLYGKALYPQNGAPVRLVVPWKYGFKSIKSIVKIDLVEYMPESMWMATNAREYGFWANVNPKVSHPRWSQATERRIGENRRRETLFLNGYADEVASLYPDLDSRDWYY